MASLFAVGLPFSYNGITNHFATSTGGSATVAAVTSADTLTLDGLSGTGAMTVGANFTASTITVNSTNVSLVTDGTHAFNSNGLVTLAGGTIDTTGVNMAWNSFNSSFASARTLTITNSTITVNGTISVPWDLATTTSLTVNATGSTINMTGGGTSLTWREASTAGSGHTWGTVNFTGSGSPVLTAVSSTFVNIGRTGTNIKTDSFTFNGGTTITGTLTLAGNTTQGVNRVLVASSVVGTQRSLTLTGGAVVISGDVDFRDIDITGSPSWTNAGAAYVGDGQGNGTLITSNITTAAPQTWSGNTTGSWSTAANWTSRVPLLQDNVAISGLTSGTVTADMPRLGANIDLTSSTGGTVNRTINTEIYGNITLNSLVAWTGAFNIATCGRGSQTITSAGKTLCGALTLQHPNGTYTLQDDLTTSTQITPNNGTLTVGANNVNTPFIALAASTSTRVMNMGSKTWTLSAASGNLINVLTSGLTFNAETSTILLSNTGASGKTFAGAGLTFYNLSIAGGGAGAITFTGANTFTNMPQITGGTKSLVWPGSTTTTITNGGNFGNGSNTITMTASAGSATLAFGSQVNANFLNLTNIPAATFIPAYAGANSTDGGGNTNWLFSSAPASGSGNLLSLGVG